MLPPTREQFHEQTDLAPSFEDLPPRRNCGAPGRPVECRAASGRCGDGARVLKTAPMHIASDPSSGAIAHWKHGALHDVVEPMADHVIMTYPSGVQRLERRTGKSVAIGTARAGVVTIIPAGSSARWDIPGPVNVVQLYTSARDCSTRIATEADASTPGDLLERTSASRPHLVPIASECCGCP